MDRKKPRIIAAMQVERHRAQGAQVHRADTRVELSHQFSSALSADVLTASTDLCGEELHGILAGAGVTAHQSVVCIPAEWLLIHTVELPPLEENDVESFLQLEIERVFPFAADDLSVSVSRFRVGQGPTHATIAAVSENYIAALSGALRAARCAPASITTAAAVLAAASGESSVMVLICGERHAEMAIAMGGGIAALRSLPLPESGAVDFDAQVLDLVRELKVTLRQLPRQGEVASILLCGLPDRVASLASALRSRLGSTGATIRIQSEGGASAGMVQAAENFLGSKPQPLEFARPHVGFLQRRLKVFGSRPLIQRVALICGVVVILVAALFLYRHMQLSSLRGRWAEVADSAAHVQGVQDDIRTWRDWFDDDAASLDALLDVTSAFPETGSVWARSLQIDGESRITCAGFASSNQECIQVVDALRKTEGVEDLRLAQMRGESPVQFSFSFRWTGGVQR